MQKGDDGNAFLAVIHSVHLFGAWAGEIVAKAVVNVKAVLAKSAGVRAVVACACGSCEEVAVWRGQVVKQLVRALAGDFAFVYFDKSLHSAIFGHSFFILSCFFYYSIIKKVKSKAKNQV